MEQETTLEHVTLTYEAKVLAAVERGELNFTGGDNGYKPWIIGCPKCGMPHEVNQKIAILENDELTFPKPIRCVYTCDSKYRIVHSKILWLE